MSKKKKTALANTVHSFIFSQVQGQGRERDKTTQAQAQQQHNSSNLKFHIPQTNTDCKTLANLLLHADLSYYKTHTHKISNKTTKLHSTQTLVHKPKKKTKVSFPTCLSCWFWIWFCVSCSSWSQKRHRRPPRRLRCLGRSFVRSKTTIKTTTSSLISTLTITLST